MKAFALDSLPVEIIHRIVIRGPTTNALALSRVNKHLRSICTNPLLYVNIIENHSGFDAYTTGNDNTWWQRLNLRTVTDWRICAKWALADHDAIHNYKAILAHHDDSSAIQMTPETLAWLPELIFQRHQFALKLSARSQAFHESRDCDLNVAYVMRRAFCDVCHVTLRDDNDGGLFDPTGTPVSTPCPADMFEKIFPDICNRVMGLRKLLELATDSGSSIDSPLLHKTDAHFVGDIMGETLNVGVFYPMLNSAINHGTVRRHHVREPNLKPPPVRNIPFDRIYNDIGTPFSNDHNDDSASWFLNRHLPVMLSPEFLVDGEWIGYHFLITPDSPPIWDAMMHGVNFKIVADRAEDLILSSQGEDASGSFTMSGAVHKSNGEVDMKKRYDNGETWEWLGVMTPFGIVATWGSRCGGWLWLWKRSWSST